MAGERSQQRHCPRQEKGDDKNVPEGIWRGNRQQVSKAETAGCMFRGFSWVESWGRHRVAVGLTLPRAPRDALVVLKVLLSHGEGRQHQPGGLGRLLPALPFPPASHPAAANCPGAGSTAGTSQPSCWEGNGRCLGPAAMLQRGGSAARG